jgi:succinate dehydrogenase / fumarate reductase flavoprotein subunit
MEEAAREILAPFERKEGESPYTIHRDLQETMQNLVGIFRNKEDLIRALEELEKLKERATLVSVEGSRLFNPGWHLAQDLKAMLTVSEAVTRSALARQESRGAHSRIDYPGLDVVWGTKNNVIVREGDTMTLRQSLVPEMSNEIRQLVAQEK